MHRLITFSTLLVVLALAGCAAGGGAYADRNPAGAWTNQHNPSPTAGW